MIEHQKALIEAVELMRQNDLDQATSILNHLREIYPDDSEVLMNLATIKLKRGNFKEGFALYEVRHNLIPLEPLPYDRYQGQKNCTVVIQFELGIGDCIQMLRYIPEFDSSVKLIVMIPNTMHNLIKRNFPQVECVNVGEYPKADYTIPIFSLAHHFGTIESQPYLTHYDMSDNNKIGIAWKGSPAFQKDKIRSIELSKLIPLFETGKQFVSLQKPISDDERKILEQYNVEIPKLWDIDSTAEVIAELNQVITVDTSIAHLSGAIGKKTKVMIYYANCWRWLMNRKDSVWYDSVELFRQPKMHDWDSVIKDIYNAL